MIRTSSRAATGGARCGRSCTGCCRSGLSRYGHELEARQLGHTLIDLVRQGDFWEHYHPMTGRGQGGEQFAWTAAIVLDILGEGHIESTTAHTKEGPDGSNPTGR